MMDGQDGRKRMTIAKPEKREEMAAADNIYSVRTAQTYSSHPSAKAQFTHSHDAVWWLVELPALDAGRQSVGSTWSELDARNRVTACNDLRHAEVAAGEGSPQLSSSHTSGCSHARRCVVAWIVRTAERMSLML